MNGHSTNTFQSEFMTHLNCGGKILDLTEPVVMGILNITPDSFYDGGKFTNPEAIIKQAGKLLNEGAAILDIGAQSTRPGAKKVSADTEIKRLIPAIKAIREVYPEAILSVDTFYSKTAIKACNAGVSIINDVSAGNEDREMFATAAGLKVPYILMHMQGTPGTMQLNPVYNDVVNDIVKFFSATINKLRKAGVTDLILDPGFGFGKTTAHNFRILNQFRTFRMFGYPLLAGLSRKSIICRTLGIKPDQALNGTTALNMVALQKGASILRVHDVREALETIRLYKELKESGTSPKNR